MREYLAVIRIIIKCFYDNISQVFVAIVFFDRKEPVYVSEIKIAYEDISEI